MKHSSTTPGPETIVAGSGITTVSDFHVSMEAWASWIDHERTSRVNVGPWRLVKKADSSGFTRGFSSLEELHKAATSIQAVQRVKPMEASIAALCASINWTIYYNNASDRLPLDGLEIRTRANFDPDLLMPAGADDEFTLGALKAEVEIRIKGHLTKEQRNRVTAVAGTAPFIQKIRNNVAITTTTY